MGRKTIKIEEIKDRINQRLRRNQFVNPLTRWELCILLEDILHATSNYNGFRYLNQEEVPAETLPGIVRIDRDEEGNPINEFPDETRRQYF